MSALRQVIDPRTGEPYSHRAPADPETIHQDLLNRFSVSGIGRVIVSRPELETPRPERVYAPEGPKRDDTLVDSRWARTGIGAFPEKANGHSLLLNPKGRGGRPRREPMNAEAADREPVRIARIPKPKPGPFDYGVLSECPYCHERDVPKIRSNQSVCQNPECKRRKRADRKRNRPIPVDLGTFDCPYCDKKGLRKIRKDRKTCGDESCKARNGVANMALRNGGKQA